MGDAGRVTLRRVSGLQTPEPDEQDEIGRLLAEDPNAHIVEGDQQAWLLTGDAVKVAHDAISPSKRS